MIRHQDISHNDLKILLKQGEIKLGGNAQLKIYGTLYCASGKKMKRENRVFFTSEKEAVQNGYRPCGHCMKKAYKAWKMEVLNFELNKHKNWLPKEGTVNYYGPVLSVQKANHYYDVLFNTIAWMHDEAIVFGKRITTKRKVAWYGDQPFHYTYSNTTKRALRWTKELLELKDLAEKTTGETYNSCLLNLYHNGEEGMAWHSDAEKELKKNGAIASLSFGATRKFGFKHKRTKEKVFLVLEHGSLLVMKDQTQTHWLHRLPPTKLVTTPRINLTFRTIDGG